MKFNKSMLMLCVCGGVSLFAMNAIAGGKVYPCDYARPLKASESNCEKCDNRCWSDITGTGMCYYDPAGDGRLCENIGKCTSNLECAPGEYCQLSDEDWDCSFEPGECKPVGSGENISYGGKTFVKGDYMTWWSADNWCKAQGKELASLGDLGIVQPIAGRCEGSDCQGANWSALQDAFGYDYYWTANPYDACNAFSVDTGLSNVFDYFRYYDAGFALCGSSALAF